MWQEDWFSACRVSMSPVCQAASRLMCVRHTGTEAHILRLQPSDTVPHGGRDGWTIVAARGGWLLSHRAEKDILILELNGN